ncbi:MAG: LacI family DNA-binding transcriptional regulator [Planctomycetota bacterium]
MGSVREIAKRASVSIATVSRVLNDDQGVGIETRRRVLEEVNASGYVRRVGKRAVAEGIALAYAGPATVATPFDQCLLSGIGRAVADKEAGEFFGNDLLIVNLKTALRPGESPSALFRRKGIKGAVLRTTEEGADICRQLTAEGFPSVVAGSRIEGGEVPVSWVDAGSRDASREAVAHMIGLGHERITVVANTRDDTDHLDRIDGWRDAMSASGLSTEDAPDAMPMVLRLPALYEQGRTILKQWLATPNELRPTAFYVADPLPALGLLRAAYDAGVSVPDDFSLVGFDDGDAQRLTMPPMSAVCQDAAELGEAAVDVLRIQMAGKVRRRDDEPSSPAAVEQRSVFTTFRAGATVGLPSSR